MTFTCEELAAATVVPPPDGYGQVYPDAVFVVDELDYGNALRVTMKYQGARYFEECVDVRDKHWWAKARLKSYLYRKFGPALSSGG